MHLRPIRESDAEGPYSEWINDPTVKTNLASRHDQLSVCQLKEYIRENSTRPDTAFLAVCRNAGGLHVGNLKIQNIDRQHQSASLSIVLGVTSDWGRGLGTETIAIAVRFCFEELQLRRLDAGCFSRNIASRRIFEKCGFQVEGLSRSVWMTDDGCHDAVRLGLLRSDPPLWSAYLQAI
ncbi:MAG: GNAT family protein [Marivibrio sp.]|uniref:GNAT family N-acetyltransferase n=1 Tax=Marivibrio sp. TaxID=2039719 RepID=UPI0032EF1CFB